jgi:predicted DNA-binding antitoxin AbrB/MazE fold protein
MTHDIDAIYDHGVFRPIQPLAMPEGARVRLRVEQGTSDSAAERQDGEAPTLLERLKNVVGSIDDLPEDSSTNLDHYLYGRPKR